MVDLSNIGETLKNTAKDKVCKAIEDKFEEFKTGAGADFKQDAGYDAALKLYNDGVKEAGCSADKLTMGFTMLLVLFTIWKMMMK